MYYSFSCKGNFNPRSREGSDIIGLRLAKRGKHDFNPRSREGSDIGDRR